MSTQCLGATTSTCIACGRLIPAQIHIDAGAVWFHKHCPEHGAQRIRIYADAEQYLRLSRYHRAGVRPLSFATSMDRPCPTACGLCPEHEQHVCMPILEITDHCDMACPACLVKTPGTYHLDRPQVAAILDRLIESEGHVDVLNLSGGEPTTSPHFREIVQECISRDKVLYVSVSTNGRRIAAEPELLRFLVDRNIILSLQFDGMEEGCYRALRGRGRSLLDEKLRLIDQVGSAGGRMSLTITAARGINEDQLAPTLDLLFAHDHILSVMIQPMAYAGRGAAMPRPEDALTIPDILRLIDGACGGRVRAGDFAPLPCSHPACFSLAFYLRAEEEFIAVRRLLELDDYLDLVQNRALIGTDSDSFEDIQRALYALWSGPSALAPDSRKAIAAIRKLIDRVNAAGGYCPRTVAGIAERSIKSIFIHHFMDRGNFDLARARKCCQVYPQPDGRLVPACVHNCLGR